MCQHLQGKSLASGLETSIKLVIYQFHLVQCLRTGKERANHDRVVSWHSENIWQMRDGALKINLIFPEE